MACDADRHVGMLLVELQLDHISCECWSARPLNLVTQFSHQ